MGEDNNGKGGAIPDGYSQLVLTLKRDTFQLQIAGRTENYDEALAMLEMATRDFEARLRAGKASELVGGIGRLPLDLLSRGPRRQQ